MGDCLNPWDVQSKHVIWYTGKTETLYSGECRYGGGEAYVLYPAEFVENGRTEMHESMGSAEQKAISD